MNHKHLHHHQQTDQAAAAAADSSDEPYLIPDPMNATDIEAEYISAIATLQPPPLPSLFLRIAPYLNGRYHIGEISYRESVPKKDLRLLLK
jgi:hypothetical protein